MDWLVRHKKHILKLIVTCNWNHPGWSFLTIKFFKKQAAKVSRVDHDIPKSSSDPN